MKAAAEKHIVHNASAAALKMALGIIAEQIDKEAQAESDRTASARSSVNSSCLLLSYVG